MYCADPGKIPPPTAGAVPNELSGLTVTLVAQLTVKKGTDFVMLFNAQGKLKPGSGKETIKTWQEFGICATNAKGESSLCAEFPRPGFPARSFTSSEDLKQDL